ncbi:hypothetical protein AAC387_Pa07g1284 [Persea americana]
MERSSVSARPFYASSTTTTTTTTTIEEEASSTSTQPQTLILRLSRPKKRVTWKEGTVDNEFLNRRSSKKCCIFHKEKPFDDDDSDEDEDNDRRSDGLDHQPNEFSDGRDRFSSDFVACCSAEGGGH